MKSETESSSSLTREAESTTWARVSTRTAPSTGSLSGDEPSASLVTSPKRPLSHLPTPCLALCFLFFTAGCRIDILRIRSGTPLKKEEFEKLEVKKTTRSEALDALGAPEKV